MIVLIFLAAVLLVMGIIILIGKGDNLIAGYNTASQEERSKYNIKRLRGLIGGLLVALAPMLFLVEAGPAPGSVLAFSSLVVFLSIISEFGSDLRRRRPQLSTRETLSYCMNSSYFVHLQDFS